MGQAHSIQPIGKWFNDQVVRSLWICGSDLAFLRATHSKKKGIQPSIAKKQATGIDDLPVEMFLQIFENLSLRETVINCANTCTDWRETIAQFILGPKLLRLARINGKFKRDIEEDGWTEEGNDTDLILSLYGKYEDYKRKYIQAG